MFPGGNHKVMITDSDKLSSFRDELNAMQSVSGLNMKYSYGYYDLEIFYQDGSKQNLNVFFTVYDGVIIDDPKNGKNYKNNKIEESLTPILNPSNN
jgi:hypothetical protein